MKSKGYFYVVCAMTMFTLSVYFFPKLNEKDKCVVVM